MINYFLDKKAILIKKIVKYLLFFCLSIFFVIIISSWVEIIFLQRNIVLRQSIIFFLFLFSFLFGLIIAKRMWQKVYPCACNLCGWEFEKFLDFDCGFGRIYKNAQCPSCISQPRHRIAGMQFKKSLSKTKKIHILHFAPEKPLEKLLYSYGKNNYLSVDIDKARAMKQEDITQLSFQDSSFDLIYCSHVLEHVINDEAAILELHRVLKLSGFAIIDVPIDYNNEKTLESPDIISPEERTAKYWQWDHVRLYGRDFPDKLRKLGFKVDISEINKFLTEKKKKRFGLEDTPLYICKKLS